jgi:uncharacterized protein (DUF2147 family)
MIRTFAALLSVGLLATPAAAADVLGTWTRPSTGAHVNFYDCDGRLCAKIVSVKNSSQADLVGTIIIKGATPAGDNEWKGDLYDPEAKKTYAGTISLHAGKLKLKGCVMAMLCENEFWTPAN